VKCYNIEMAFVSCVSGPTVGKNEVVGTPCDFHIELTVLAEAWTCLGLELYLLINCVIVTF
jgi:hypothetical protein